MTGAQSDRLSAELTPLQVASMSTPLPDFLALDDIPAYLGQAYSEAKLGGIQFVFIETRAMNLLVGRKGHGKETQPAYNIKSMIKKELEDAETDLTQVFITALQKINNYKHDRSPTADTNN